MHARTVISMLYGELRGYRRVAIRRQAMANERLDRSALQRMADDQFQHHVQRSIQRFPQYAARVAAHRGSLPQRHELLPQGELPIWTRRQQIEFFAHQARPSDSLYIHSTGGSTGEVVRFHVTRESYEWRTAIMDRAYGWARAEEGVHSLHVWGSKQPHGLSAALKRRVHVALQRRRYFDVCCEFTDAERAACCALINEMRPSAIVGYTGMLVDLARYAREHQALDWKANTLISTAEAMQCGQRELLEEELAEEVFDSYGSREFMNIGTECEMHDGYHINADSLLVEVVDEYGVPVSPGTEGRIVVTDFRNAATPFIRYEIGDRGVLAPPDQKCWCMRPFPILRRVEGRSQDIIYTRRGMISALNVEDALEQFDWIEGYQMVQPSRDRLIIRLLTRVELTPDKRSLVAGTLRGQLGETTVEFERVSELSRKPNGKIELVISSIRDVA